MDPMGRPAKLPPHTWAEIIRRRLSGETARSLAREFGITEASVRKRVGSQSTQEVQCVATKLAEAQTALEALPERLRFDALNLADKLRNISGSLASSAELHAKTSHRLAALANSKVQEIDDAAPLDNASRDALKDVAVLTRMSNDSAVVPLNLLNANKDAMQAEANRPPAAKSLRDFYGDSDEEGMPV